MKKKIINGLLMAAMLFTATTSFVSCKDNVDDELVSVYSTLGDVEKKLSDRLADLQKQHDALKERVGKNETDIANLQTEMKNVQTEITNIKTELTSIKTDIQTLKDDVQDVKDRLGKAEKAIEQLQKDMAEMEKRIYEAMKQIITDVSVNNTINRVIGTWNTPGLNIKALAAFYGDNATSISKFPVTGTARNVYPEEVENQLFADEILETYKFGKDEIITDDEFNAGKVYFTVTTPGLSEGKFDISGFELTLEDSQGKTAPVSFSNVKPSNYLIHWGFFKSQTPYLFPTEKTEANINGFYEADANIAIKDLHSASFGTKTSFDFKELTELFKKSVENIKNAGGAKNKAIQIGKEAAQLLKDIYSNHMSDNHKNQFNPTFHPQRLVMTKTQNDVTYRAQTADIDMVCTAVKPLSYNAFYELELKAAKHVSFKKVENAIARIAEIIKEKTSINVANVEFKKITKDGMTIGEGGNTFVLVNAGGKTNTIPAGAIGIEAGLIDPLITAINAGMPVDQLNEMIQNLGKVNGLGTTVTDYAKRLNDYIEEFGNKIVFALNSHQLTRALAPCIFFESAEGIARMQEGLNLEHGMMTIYMSSPTEELLAPAFKKYLAVKKNGKTVFGKVFDGSAQLYTLDLTELGDYEVILSCVDYYGYICTKKYTLHVIC